MEATIITFLIAFPVVGALSRRWVGLLLPLLAWPLLYLGLARGWWGNGLGDGWQFAAAALLAAGVITTGLAVAIARRMSRPKERELQVA
ncbi:MAG TPA: hypothetical protein VGQ84_00685 [Gaiellaceae bacterium]|jgi:hypothetical protein|nr:hypothetical protein [Gaiellaceae bacterium]